jgi:hypothetical protein
MKQQDLVRMDLTTNYMGLILGNPLIASASPLNHDPLTLRALEDHGAGAVVLPSIFEEEILAERREFEVCIEALPARGFAEAQTYFPTYAGYGFGPQRYLEIVRRAKQAIEIPVIASLNCVTHAGWVDYARLLQQAGADAIELNIYVIPADLTTSGRHRTAVPRYPGGGQGGGPDPHCHQAQSLFQCGWGTGTYTGRRRCCCARPVQSVLSARYRHRLAPPVDGSGAQHAL